MSGNLADGVTQATIDRQLDTVQCIHCKREYCDSPPCCETVERLLLPDAVLCHNCAWVGDVSEIERHVLININPGKWEFQDVCPVCESCNWMRTGDDWEVRR